MLRLRQLAAGYDRHLTQRPLLVKSLSSGTIVCAADATTQAMGREPFDTRRTAIIGVGYGACWFAPVMHAVTTGWARYVPSTSFGPLVFKVSVDMLVAFPINISAMIALQAVSRAEDAASADCVAAVRSNLWPSLCAGWSVWPLITFAIYSGAVPLSYRVLAMNTCSFAWNSFMVSRFTCADTPPPEGAPNALAATVHDS